MVNKDRLHPQFDFYKASPIDHLSSFLTNQVFINRMGIFGDSSKFEFFRGKKTQKIPKVKLIPVPKISPKIFWGFLGIKPQKNSKFNLPSSPKNPQNFIKPCPRPRPVPEIRGRGRGKSGIGAPFPHPSLY